MFHMYFESGVQEFTLISILEKCALKTARENLWGMFTKRVVCLLMLK